MKIDGSLGDVPITEVGPCAARQEKEGYDGLWSIETGHDPFLPLAVAALHTNDVQLGTSIAVAFARSPMNLAMLANDIQLASEGRFLLGVGSQVRAHIEKRFSMPWSQPAARMREFILAVRAIWAAWNEDAPLDFRGDFYTHTLMTPFFNPGPNPYGPPKVLLAAVGSRMTEVAGEVADGIFIHGLTSDRYFKEVTVPAYERGLAKVSRNVADFDVCFPCFVVTGGTASEMEASARAARQSIAFYGSTPAYRGVLELHGWGELQTELNVLSKSARENKWTEMGDLIDADILDAFAVVAEPGDLVASLKDRFEGTVTRLNLFAHGRPEQVDWAQIVQDLKAG